MRQEIAIGVPALNIDEVRAHLAGTKRMLIIGCVVYRDRFQWWGTRRTDFTFEMEPRPAREGEAPGTVYGFKFATDGYNKAD